MLRLDLQMSQRLRVLGGEPKDVAHRRTVAVRRDPAAEPTAVIRRRTASAVNPVFDSTAAPLPSPNTNRPSNRWSLPTWSHPMRLDSSLASAKTRCDLLENSLPVTFGVNSEPENSALISSPVIAPSWNLAVAVEFLLLKDTSAVSRTLGSCSRSTGMPADLPCSSAFATSSSQVISVGCRCGEAGRSFQPTSSPTGREPGASGFQFGRHRAVQCRPRVSCSHVNMPGVRPTQESP